MTLVAAATKINLKKFENLAMIAKSITIIFVNLSNKLT